MTKIQMFQTVPVLEVANMILFLTLVKLIFEFVSDFNIRISNFAMAPTYIMPSGLSLKSGPLDPDFYWGKQSSALLFFFFRRYQRWISRREAESFKN